MSRRDGDVVDVPVWPSGATWDPATSEVVLSDGDRAGLGDQIEAGGGFRSGGGLIREVSHLDVRKFAERCAREVGSGSVFLIQGPVDVIVAAP